MRTTMTTYLQKGCFATVAFLLAACFALAPRAQAQEFDFSGFVKSSYYYDTRQVITARDIDFLLYPVADADPDEDDPTDVDNLSSFQLFSRLGVGISEFGTQVLGGDVSGLVEADFFGPGTISPAQENFFRLRRAFAKLVWDDREVLFGLEWTPLFTLSAFPHTVATEAGTPFNPFSRQPMIKLTLKPGNLRVIGIASWQFDAFVDAALTVPESFADEATALGGALDGIDAQQQSSIPSLHGHLQYVSGNATLGIGGYFKTLRPFPLSDRFYSGAGTAYVALTTPNVIFRAKTVYGSVRDHVGVGGYIYDPDAAGVFGDSDGFKQINTLTGWLEVEGTGTVAPGLFAGYLTNLGVSDELESDLADISYATRSVTPNANSIASVWEIAPRLALNYGPLRFAFEVQITTAQYSSNFDENFAPDPTDDEDSVTNVRGDFTVFLFF